MIEYQKLAAQKKRWSRPTIWEYVAIIVALLALGVASAYPQTPTTAVEDTTNTVVKVGDSANKALRVNVVAGGGGGGGAVTQGAGAGAATNFWNFRLTDGTNFYDGLTNTQLRAAAIDVTCVAGCTPGGSFADASAFTFGTTAVGIFGAVVDDVGTNTVAENSAGAPRMTASRILLVDASLSSSLPLPADASSETTLALVLAELVDQSAELSTQTGVLSGMTTPSDQQHVIVDSPAFNLEATQLLVKAKTDNLDVALSTRLKPADTLTAVTTVGTITNAVTVTDGAGALNTIVDSGSITATQATGTNLHTVVDSGAVTVSDGAGALNVIVDSGALTANAGTNLNTSALALDATLTNRLPAGANPADNESNTSSQSRVGAYNFIYDGSTWDRWTGAITGTVTANAGTGTFTVGDGAGALNVIVDSGAITNTPPSNQSVNLTQVVGTAADVNSGTKSAGTLRVVLATDQPALTNKLLVTPDSVALPANQSVNAAQLAGTTTDTNSGLKSAGTLRVVLATDQPALTNKLLVTPDSVALPANQSVNLAQVAGATTATGNGTAAGSLRVSIASDSTGNIATIGTSVVPGTAATNLGKAEDAGHTSADTGVFTLGVRKDTNAQLTSADADYSPYAVDAYGAQFMRSDNPNRIQCRLTTTATTSTAITGCAAPGAGLAIYITDISVYGGVALAITAAATVQSGTGGTCGTGTVINHYCQHPATAGCEVHYSTAVRAVTNGEVCILDATTGTKFITISGFISP